MPSNVLMFEFLAVDHFGPVAEHVSRKLDGVGERMGAVGRAAAFGIGKVAVGGLAAFAFEMVKGVSAATEYQSLQLKTAAVIKSTGNQAHLSVAGIDELAHSLQETSGVQESLVINSENVLATFTNVRNSTGKNNDIFNQGTARILDMSVALGEDLQSATIQVGKALNDPIKGITALSRVGVTFNATQKEQIKHLVNTGHLMAAQKIILKELGKEFGGAAKAAGSGFAGSLARVRNALEDTFRDMAAKLLPSLTIAANWLAERLPGAIKFLGGILGALGGWLAKVGAGFLRLARQYLPPVIGYLKIFAAFMLGLVHTYGPLVVKIVQAIGDKLAKLAGTRIFFVTMAGAVSGLLIPVLGVLIGVVASLAVSLWALIAPLLPFLAIGAAVAAVAYLIATHWSAITKVLRIFSPLIQIVAHYFSDMLLPALKSAAAQIFPQLKKAIDTIGAAFRDHMDIIRTFGQVFMFILKVVGVALALLALTLVKVVIPVIAKLIVIVLSAVGPIVRALLSITGMLINVIKGIASFAVNAVRLISNIAGDIIGVFSNAGKWLENAGRAIVNGLVSGILTVGPHIATAVKHLVDFFIVKPFGAPAKLLLNVGKVIIGGLVFGIKLAITELAMMVSAVIDAVRGPFKSAVSWLNKYGRLLVQGFWGGIKAILGWFMGMIHSWITNLLSPWVTAGKWLYNVGRSLVTGLFNGIISLAKTIGGWINDHVVQPVIHAVKWFFGIRSPSTVFAQIGVWLIQGFLNGIADKWRAVMSWFGRIRGWVTGVFRNALSWLTSAGRLVFQSLWNGLQNSWARINGWLGRIRGWIGGHFNGAIKWLFNVGYQVLHGFLQGLQAIWKVVTGWIGGIATWIRNNKGPVSLDARLLIPAGKAIMGGFLSGLKSGAGKAWQFVKSIGGKTKEMMAKALGWIPGVGWLSANVKFGNTGSGGKGFPSSVARWAGIVRNILQMEGLDTSLVPKVLRQISTESGGNPNIIQQVHDINWPNNRAQGLMQVIPTTFRAFHWPGTSWSEMDPIANVAAALNYARHRYGTNLSGLGEGHGYDTGGIARGAGWWRKGPQPERILSPRQTAWFERAMAQGIRSTGGHGHCGVTLILNAPNYVGSRRELLDEFNRFARLGQLDSIVRMASR